MASCLISSLLKQILFQLIILCLFFEKKKIESRYKPALQSYHGILRQTVTLVTSKSNFYHLLDSFVAYEP